MKKFLALLLALVLCCGVACAQAATLTKDDLVGNWYTVYEDVIPIYLVLNENQTFDAFIPADLPIEEKAFDGTWDFDGAALTLHCADKDIPLTLDGIAFVGELFGLTVELHSEYMEDILEVLVAMDDSPDGLELN